MTRITFRLTLWLALLVAAVIAVVSCGPSATPTPTPRPPTPTATPAPAPTLKIVKPAAGASIVAGNVEVAIEVSNFTIVQPGGAPVAGQGHVHYYLDAEIPTTPGQPAVTAPGTYKASSSAAATWENVAPGTHTLGVQLVNNNHTPLTPAVTARVEITVAPVAPTVKITRPAEGASLAEGNVEVAIEVGNFTLAAPGGPVVGGQGHVHYYLDVEIPTTPGQPAVTAAGTYKATSSGTATWENVALGTHTLGVQLVNNNHTPLSPPVTAKVEITVTPKALIPTVKIVKPSAGSSLPVGSVEVAIEVGNFTLAAPGGPVVAGQGHVHYYLDVAIPTAPGAPAVTAAGTYKATGSATATWENVTAGTHTLGVQLVNNNHTPLTPPVTTTVSITLAPAASAGVRFTKPVAGSSVAAGSVDVAIEVGNFTLVAPGGANAPAQGHVHYYLDVEIPTTPGRPAVTAAGTYKATSATTATWENVSAGQHTLGVQLVNSDHTPLASPVTASIAITVTPPAAGPSLKILRPTPGASVPAGNLQVAIEVANFSIVAPGGAAVAGQGHVHYYLDVAIPTTPGIPAVTAAVTYEAAPTNTATWPNVAAGTHTLGVQLVNNDHTPLNPPVTARVSILVTPTGAGEGEGGVTAEPTPTPPPVYVPPSYPYGY